MKTWHYSLRNDRRGEGWARITISENGMFSAVSDWGNYAYLWTHTGTEDIREFFLDAEKEWDYFARKLRAEKVVNEEASFKALKQEVLKQRRSGDLTKDQAREAWDEIELYTNWNEYLGAASSSIDEPWDFTVQEHHPDVVSFCKRVLPRLAEILRAELAGKKVQIDHVIDAELINPKGFRISRSRLASCVRTIQRFRTLQDMLNDSWVKSCEVKGEYLYPQQLPCGVVTRQNVEHLVEVLKCFEGSVDLALTWSSGERDGLRLANHRVTTHSVELRLV